MTKGIGNQLFLAPVDLNKPARVLDIGTGTGVCEYLFSIAFRQFMLTETGAISVGEEYPNAEVCKSFPI